MTQEQWAQIKYFTKEEFVCKCCGVEDMDFTFMLDLDAMRAKRGKKMKPSSGYRCKKHNKAVGGSPMSFHTSTQRRKAKAVDFPIRYASAYDLLKLAFEFFFYGIGIDQRGDGRFLHFDKRPFEKRRLFTY